MDALVETFEERLQEINAYLDLLDAVERQVQEGAPNMGTDKITVQQQRIMYSAVYLQLYNLVEATVTWCLEAVCEAASENARWVPGDLISELRREWIRTKARTHVELNGENRLAATIEFCEHLIQALPVSGWQIERRSAGSWDDLLIEDMTARIGCRIQLSQAVRTGIKRKIRDDKSALALIRDFRNRLAHGSLSFTECGEGVTAKELREIKNSTGNYLREIVDSFCRYIATFEFITPARRPAAGAK